MKFNQFGMSYIEVLVAIGLLGIVILCFSAITLRIITDSRQALLQSIALEQAYGMREMLSVMPNLDADMILVWNKESKRLLPEGFGEIVPAGSGKYNIHVKWRAYDGDWQCELPKEEHRSCLELTR